VAGLYARRLGVDFLMRASLMAAMSGAVLLWWNPAKVTNLVAVAVIGFAIAPIFPALISGTAQRVGVRHAANTIGVQVAAASLGMAFIPGLVGVLAGRISLEVVPVCLVVLLVALSGFYTLAVKVGVRS